MGFAFGLESVQSRLSPAVGASSQEPRRGAGNFSAVSSVTAMPRLCAEAAKSLPCPQAPFWALQNLWQPLDVVFPDRADIWDWAETPTSPLPSGRGLSGPEVPQELRGPVGTGSSS